ncbi:sigma-70 family RNA polymerase sigma factor, partial [Singulisphaera rosea]
MNESPATRHSLIVKLRDPADTDAWREFVALYEPLVYRLVRRNGVQDADAQDLCQEVFQALARSIDRWDPDRGGFRSWL